MAKRELVNAAAIIGARLFAMHVETRQAIDAAHAAGTSQTAAMNANALERLRVSSILPCLPDNDRLVDRLRVLRGGQSTLMCPIRECI